MLEVWERVVRDWERRFRRMCAIYLCELDNFGAGMGRENEPSDFSLREKSSLMMWVKESIIMSSIPLSSRAFWTLV